MDLFVLSKGVGQLTEALAGSVPVECRAKVVSVIEAEGRINVAVEGIDGTRQVLNADGVVLALPGPSVTNLWPGCTKPERTFLGHPSYASAVVVHLCTNKDWGYAGHHGFLFPGRSGRKTICVALEHVRYRGRAPNGKSLLYTGPRLDEKTSLLSAPDAEVIDICMGDIESVFPGIRDAIYSVFVFCWDHALPWFPIGYFRGLRDFLNVRTVGWIELAGDYSFGVLSGFLDAWLKEPVSFAEKAYSKK